jgi:hypothetical protein
MDIFESIGFINLCGFSPSFDILHDQPKESDTVRKVLLVGPCEIGHILKS